MLDSFSIETISLCPDCLERIPAKKIEENENVYLQKECSKHGSFKTLIWRGSIQTYIEWSMNSENAVGPLRSIVPVKDGCPYDCGLCSEHMANACTMVMNVTQGCNLNCPVCYANTNDSNSNDPNLENIRRMYETVIEVNGTPTIQISGGEPTIRDDLPEIVRIGKEVGFKHIMINSNGVRTATDKRYLKMLKDAGLGTIYLQFDGITDEVYQYTRGANLFDLKKRTIENCSECQIGVVLVPTMIPGVNDHQVGDIIQFAKERIPTVRGVHFQPRGFLGRYPTPPKDEDRITIPDMILYLETQTKGEVQADHLLPRRSKEAHCSFSSIYVLRNGKLEAIRKRKLVDKMSKGDRRPPWMIARSFMEGHWQSKKDENLLFEKKCNCWENIYREIANHGFTISCMPFQDVWSVDLDRLRKCCSHVILPNLKIMPFCSYYLTNYNGRRLHPEVVGTQANWT